MDELRENHDMKNIAPIPLCDLKLTQLSSVTKRPNYKRSEITPGIVHIGLGNFHRAHQAWYTHRLMQQGLAFDWGIIGAGVKNYDEAQRKKLMEQDYLTTLIELAPKGVSAEIVGSMIGYTPVQNDNQALIQQMADPAIRIVSLTVTEGGYFLDPATKQFDPKHASIVYDVANPTSPRTSFGAILAALKIRKDNGLGPFTCQSCDNLPGNGMILQQVISKLAEMIDPSLCDWITRHVSFPNSMVDCIVPATGAYEMALVRSFGIIDQVPVVHENFRQWVIEDDFCAGRPSWERVGVKFSNQVHEYEAMKLRILNGGHQIIAAPSELLGLQTISQAMGRPEIKAFLRKIALTEIAPHVRAVPDMDIMSYVDLVDQRFTNPAIHDTVRRVAFDGSSRHTGAVLPVIRDAIATDKPLEGLALSQALWCKMCAGIRDDGSIIQANDPIWNDLMRAARNPLTWLNQSQIYGDIATNQRFADAFLGWARVLKDKNVIDALRVYLNGS